MNVIGIVAEYNPFHTGHAYQIAQSRQQLAEDCPVVVVMSGNWVQQANCAVLDKWNRARMAVLGGADLVLELPTVWATSSAERFARGAITLLDATGIVTHLSFGSESGNLDGLSCVAACLDTPEFSASLRQALEQGTSFPAARQTAVQTLIGTHADLLRHANNNLGIEYLRSLSALDSSIRPITVTRRGAGHNTLTGSERPLHVSATQIRAWLKEGALQAAQPYLLPDTSSHFPNQIPDLIHVQRAILAQFRRMDVCDWNNLPDSGTAEGLALRLWKAGHKAGSLEEFYSLTATKRYTNARLRRLVLWSYLGLSSPDFSDSPSYLRVLACNDRGREILKRMKKTASLPILTKPAHARVLSPCGKAAFELECRCTDLYDLCFPSPPSPGREWTTNPVMVGLTTGRDSDV